MALGPELITNGNFDGGTTGWDLGPVGFYNNDNKLSVTDGFYPGTGSEIAEQQISLTNGNYYWVSLRISGISGRLAVFFMNGGNRGDVNKYQCTSSKVIQLIIKADVFGDNNPDNYIVFKAESNCDSVTIDNVSVKEVLLSDLSFGPDLVTNGNFTGSASSWVLATGWTYNSNNIIHTVSHTGGADNPITFDNDEAQYLVQMDTGGSVGFMTAQVEDGLDMGDIPFNTTTGYIFAQSLFGTPDGYLHLYPTSDFDGTVDNVSCKKIIGLITNLFLQTVQMVGADLGDVQTINAGKDDSGTPIYYELETQGLEFGNVFHRKKISDKIVVFTKDGLDSNLLGKTDDNDYKNIQINLSNRVNIGQKINLEGNTMRFKWFGEANEATPILEGFYIEKVEDVGITKN